MASSKNFFPAMCVFALLFLLLDPASAWNPFHRPSFIHEPIGILARVFRIEVHRYDDDKCKVDPMSEGKVMIEGQCLDWDDGREFTSMAVKWKDYDWWFETAGQYGNCTVQAFEDEKCKGRVAAQRHDANLVLADGSKWAQCWWAFRFEDGTPATAKSVRTTCFR